MPRMSGAKFRVQMMQAYGVTHAYYGGEPGNVEELWVFPDTDFARLAQDMGGFGIRVHHPGEIQSALDQAVAADKPAVVDVVSEINGIAPRAWTPS